MLCEKMMLNCGHKLRMKTFERASVDGLCPLFECRCTLTENEQKELNTQVILWKTPMWELHQYGRPATAIERQQRNAYIASRPKPMGQCQGTTMAGKPCTCTAMRSNGSYCNKHVLQQVTA